MKSCTNMKTRVLALILTVLMTVGILPVSVFAVGGESTGGGDENPALTLEELEDVLGDRLSYYNDFNDVKTTTAGMGDFNASGSKANFMEVRNGANTSFISNGILTYASALDSAAADGAGRYKASLNLYTQAEGNNKPNTAMSGKNVVYQADYKLGTAMLNGTLASLSCTLVKGTTVSSNPVYVSSTGKLLLNTDGDSDGDKEIGQLSKNEFTTVGFAINVKDNKIDVYINGDHAGQTNLLTTAQQTKVAEYAGTYKDGFGLTSVGCYRESSNTAANNGVVFYVDNVALYESSRYVSSLVAYKLYNDSTNSGYKCEGGAVYYYEEGVKKGNVTSADGILKADATGKVFFGETPVESLEDYYKSVKPNTNVIDIIPLDGILSGRYQCQDSHNYYCYDKDKKLVKDKKAYDIAIAVSGVDATGVVGFEIDKNGVTKPLEGYHEVAEGVSYYYINGIRSTGLQPLDSDTWLFINADFTLWEGFKFHEGPLYFFDKDNACKGKLYTGVYFDEGKSVSQYYNNGVLVTDGLIDAVTTKYFADENGTLLTGLRKDEVSGHSYFFNTEGPNKYQMAINTRVVCDGIVLDIDETGVINLADDRLYGTWSKIGVDEHGNDIYCYSDTSGNVVKGFAYIDKAPDGTSTGGYYFFEDDGKMLREGFANVYGTVMYFHKDGKAPSGVVYVSVDAKNFPSITPKTEAAGKYMNFINGTFVEGETAAIFDGKKLYFYDGVCFIEEELDEENPEVLITIIKDGRNDYFYFATVGGKYSTTFASYPCYKVTVYNVTTGKYVEIAAGEEGVYTFDAAGTYEVRYTAVPHTLGAEPIYTKNPTCGSDGYHEYQCTVCGETVKVAITTRPAHDFSVEPDIVKAPTCKNDGVGVIWCKGGCNISETVTIPATGVHVFKNWDGKPATCTSAGYRYSECEYDDCSEYKHETLPMLDHVFENYVSGNVPNCVTGAEMTAKCEHCDATDTVVTAPDYNNHVNGNANGTLDRYDEACVENFERFYVVTPSTCYEEGVAVYRCKDCGGFVYQVAIEKDPDNHHYNEYQEYLAVIDEDGKLIETVKMVGNEIFRDGKKVESPDLSGSSNREHMRNNSLMLCGNNAQWRIDCASGCVDEKLSTPRKEVVHYTVVEDIEATYSHDIDRDSDGNFIRYTTDDPENPLFGYHYYICRKCGKAFDAKPHEFAKFETGNGTEHVIKCTCVVEGDGVIYSVKQPCNIVVRYDKDNHWKGCECGYYEENPTSHDTANATHSHDGKYCWNIECSCGYINKEEYTWTYVVKTEATCHSTGIKEKVCDKCGEVIETETIGRKPHVITGEISTDGAGHWYECINEGCTFVYRYQKHSYVAVPVLGGGTHNICTVCQYHEGQTYKSDANGHWVYCAVCDAEGELAPHTAATTCDKCDYFMVSTKEEEE